MYDSNLVGKYERSSLKLKIRAPTIQYHNRGEYLERTALLGGFFFKKAGTSLDQALLFERQKEHPYDLPLEFVKKIVEVETFQFFRPSIFVDHNTNRKQVPILELFHVPTRSLITLDQLSEEELLKLVRELEQKPPKKRHNPEITEEDKAQRI